ncbi:MAG: FAD-dependent oxidoreductase, partial [Bacteroidota bacterium]
MDYDLLVIGGGAAGLTSAGIGANFGAKTAMIEAHRLGGDCTWTGCMPSKALLQAAHVAHAMKTASRYGITSMTPEVDFRAVMEQVHETVLEIYHDADDPQIFRDMGIDVKFGRARFIDPHTVELDGEDAGRFSARKIIIAAGSKASVPPIEGLRDAGFLTNETLFELREQPSRLVIIGAGPIGCEMAQAFQRLGTDVTVVDRASRILGKDDPELAEMLRERLEAEGVRFVLDADVQRIEAGDLGKGDTGKRVHIAAGGETHVIESDELLIAAGRTPNTASLNLEAAGVVYGPHGITIDQRCRTNVEHIFAVGDIALTHKFTHMAEHSAKTAAT